MRYAISLRPVRRSTFNPTQLDPTQPNPPQLNPTKPSPSQPNSAQHATAARPLFPTHNFHAALPPHPTAARPLFHPASPNPTSPMLFRFRFTRRVAHPAPHLASTLSAMSNAHYVPHDEEEGDCTHLWKDVVQQRIAEYQQAFGGRLFSVADLIDALFSDADFSDVHRTMRPGWWTLVPLMDPRGASPQLKRRLLLTLLLATLHEAQRMDIEN